MTKKKPDLPNYIEACAWRQTEQQPLETKIEACNKCYALHDSVTAKTGFCIHMRQYGIPALKEGKA